jgi:hypothetical protein
MRKEYDLRSLRVKRRGPAAAAAFAQKAARNVASKPPNGGTPRVKRHR